MTTVLCIRNDKQVVLAADGQVSLGATIIKAHTNKLRRLGTKQEVLVGFAGSTSDALALVERLEEKLNTHSYHLKRACVELSKDWRRDKYLQKLEAMMIAADKTITLLLTGTGDVLEPDYKAVAIGSGGNYALSASLALLDYEPDLRKIAMRAMQIAAQTCVYSNSHVNYLQLDIVEELPPMQRPMQHLKLHSTNSTEPVSVIEASNLQANYHNLESVTNSGHNLEDK